MKKQKLTSEERLEKKFAERRKWLALEKQLTFLGRTQPFTMICPVCGQEVIGTAKVRRMHWFWRNTRLEFSLDTLHDCPQSAMSPKEAYALMHDSGLTIQQLQDQKHLSAEEIEGIKNSGSLWEKE